MSLRGKLRAILFAFVLQAGAFSGVVMRPEDIEALLHAHNQVKIEEQIRQEDEEGEDL